MSLHTVSYLLRQQKQHCGKRYMLTAQTLIQFKKLDAKGVPITLILTAMKFIDPSTGWFKIIKVPSIDKTSARISRLFNQTWLNRYPIPKRVRFDNGSKFKKDFIPLLKDFDVKHKPTSIKNPQSNAIIERVYHVVGNMLRTYSLTARTDFFVPFASKS